MSGVSKRLWVTFISVLLLGGLVFFGCGEDSDSGTEPDPDTTDPEVSISASTQLVFNAGDVTYTATDNEGVTEVEFYEDSDLIATDNGEDWSPFVAEFTATEFAHTIGFWAEWLDDSSYELDNVSLSIKATD